MGRHSKLAGIKLACGYVDLIACWAPILLKFLRKKKIVTLLGTWS